MVECISNPKCRAAQAPLRLLWEDAPEHGVLRPSEVQVWAVELDRPENDPSIFEAVLSSDERERAGCYHFDLHRRRFIRGRAALRLLLGEYLGFRPEKLQFSYGSNGKPFLAGAAANKLWFNVAHSDSLALIAFAEFAEVGVDVEFVRRLPDFDDLVNRFFSQRESACFGRLQDESKSVAFFNLWTRKEALLKATGDGICNALNRVEVTFLPHEPARLLALPDNQETCNWTLCELAPAEGYAAAFAIERRDLQLKCWRFTPDGEITEPSAKVRELV